MDIVNIDALKAQGRILDAADVDPNEDYFVLGKYTNKYTTDNFKYTKYPVWAIKAGDVMGVQSVTGLNTDNTDPFNPIVKISVDGVTITGEGTPASPLVANAGSTFQYEIGEYVPSEGGVIAHRWLSTSAGGFPTAGTVQNYLVVDTTDLSTGAPWDDGASVDISNVESTWNGKTNTDNLIAAGAGGGITAGTAAVLCDASSNNSKTDWYLPAMDELNKIWINRWDIAQGLENAPGGTQLAYEVYWSSTQYNSSEAWAIYLLNGLTSHGDKTGNYHVRAMRKFSI